MAFPLFLHPPTSLISNCLSLFSGTPHFSFIFLHPEGSKGGIRKGIKFWIERIITFMGELSFRGIQFQNHKDMPPKVIMWKKLCSSILHKTNQNPLKKKKGVLLSEASKEFLPLCSLGKWQQQPTTYCLIWFDSKFIFQVDRLTASGGVKPYTHQIASLHKGTFK